MPQLLIVNDNHAMTFPDGNVKFINSTFHLFLGGFHRLRVAISSPIYGSSGELQEFNVDGVKVYARFPYGAAKNFYMKLPVIAVSYIRNFLNLFRRYDAVMLVVPNSSAPLVYISTLLTRKPLILYVVGDVKEVVSSNNTYHGLTRLIAISIARWEWWFTKFLSRRKTTFVLGGKMLRKLYQSDARLFPARTSLIKETDVRVPEALPQMGCYKMLSVGRLTGEKGINIALQALALLRNKGWNISYTIIGKGSEQEVLEKLVRSLGIAEYVTFYGNLPHGDLTAHYRQSDLFVLPSLSEGVPKVVFEAMAAGISVIATKVGGVPELLGDGERGWLCEVGSVDALAKAIESCLTQEDVAQLKLLAAHSYILEHTMEAETRHIEDVILREAFTMESFDEST